MQRWLFAIVATVLAYVTLLKLPTLLGDFVYGLGGGADQLVDDAGPLLALGLALWVLFGADKPLARPWRLGGVAVAYVVGVTLLRHSIEYLHIPRTYEYQPTILIISVLLIALGLLLTIGDFDETRLRRWTLFSLLLRRGLLPVHRLPSLVLAAGDIQVRAVPVHTGAASNRRDIAQTLER
jgi:hypothetical protein